MSKPIYPQVCTVGERERGKFGYAYSPLESLWDLVKNAVSKVTPLEILIVQIWGVCDVGEVQKSIP